MAYINLETQQRLREQYHTGLLTYLPANYDLPEKVRPALLLRCHQGQKLRWLGLRQDEQLHWFGVDGDRELLCPYCWEQSSCAREFCFAPADHELALGTIPLGTPTARRLLKQSRGWIEASQSYEKIQLGLSSMFLNSLRFASIVCLLADTVMLLRAHALCGQPQSSNLVKELLPTQLGLGLD